jgi:RHS repeat-associated protein
VLLAPAGWPIGHDLELRLTSDLRDAFNRAPVGEPRATLRITAPGAVSVHHDRLAVDYDSIAAASGTLGGRFPGGQALLFQGLWTDPVTGIAYARNRWYDARTASWLSEDPLGPVDSPNLYAFVGWGPHVGTDPMGECKWNDWQCWLAVKRDFELTMTIKVGVGGAKMAAHAVYGAADKISFGGFSRIEANAETFFSTEGTLIERGNAAAKAGNTAALDSMTFGYWSADDKWGHTKGIVGGALGSQKYELGINQMFESCPSGDWEMCIRGGAELLGGVSQTVLTVAGIAEGGQRFGLFKGTRLGASSVAPELAADEIVTWVDEGGNLRAGKSAGMRPDAYRYQSSAPGARSSVLTGRSQAPYLEFTTPEGEIIGVKFDGVTSTELIDRKLNPFFSQKAVDEATRQAAVAQHYGLQAVWELPTPKAVSAAERFLNVNSISGIVVRQAP